MLGAVWGCGVIWNVWERTGSTHVLLGIVNERGQEAANSAAAARFGHGRRLVGGRPASYQRRLVVLPGATAGGPLL